MPDLSPTLTEVARAGVQTTRRALPEFKLIQSSVMKRRTAHNAAPPSKSPIVDFATVLPFDAYWGGILADQIFHVVYCHFLSHAAMSNLSAQCAREHTSRERHPDMDKARDPRLSAF
jgi:hypothetical protein